MVKITGTDQASIMAQNRVAKSNSSPGPRSAIRRPVVIGAPGRRVPMPKLPPVGISPLGTTLAPGHVIGNAHSGTPDVLPWTPLVSSLKKRIGPYEKLPPWKHLDPSSQPSYAKPGVDYLSPQIQVLTPPASSGSGGVGTGAGGGGGGGGGYGGGIGGGGGGRLK